MTFMPPMEELMPSVHWIVTISTIADKSGHITVDNHSDHNDPNDLDRKNRIRFYFSDGLRGCNDRERSKRSYGHESANVNN